MTLDDRLVAARRDYRQLDQGPMAGRSPQSDPSAPAPRQRWVLSIAAAVLVVAVVVALVWGRSDREHPPVSVDTRSTVTVPVTDAPPINGDSAPLEPDPAVELDVPGPYEDGQQVTVSVPSGFSTDWLNEWPVLCSTVASSGGRVTSCDHVVPLPASEGYGDVAIGTDRDTRLVELRRRVFTPLGYRDCAEDEVSCHVVVRRADGTAAASARLQFRGEANPIRVGIDAEAAAAPGRFLVTAHGVDGGAPGAASGGYALTVCAFGEGEPAEDPSGRPWGDPSNWFPVRPGLGVNCDTLDPSHWAPPPVPEGGTVEIDLTRELYGYGGWSDCRRQACYVVATPIEGSANGSGPGLRPSDAVAVRLPVDPEVTASSRPSLSIVEYGPTRQGEITVLVSDVPTSYEAMVGVCRMSAPEQCSYSVASQGSGPGMRVVTLAGDLAGCGRDECFLALPGAGEGLRPVATVWLPVGLVSDGSGRAS